MNNYIALHNGIIHEERVSTIAASPLVSYSIPEYLRIRYFVMPFAVRVSFFFNDTSFFQIWQRASTRAPETRNPGCIRRPSRCELAFGERGGLVGRLHLGSGRGKKCKLEKRAISIKRNFAMVNGARKVNAALSLSLVDTKLVHSFRLTSLESLISRIPCQRTQRMKESRNNTHPNSRYTPCLRYTEINYIRECMWQRGKVVEERKLRNGIWRSAGKS